MRTHKEKLDGNGERGQGQQNDVQLTGYKEKSEKLSGGGICVKV